MICRTHTANYQCRKTQQLSQTVERYSAQQLLIVKLADASMWTYVGVRTYVGDFLSTSRVIFVRPNAARG